MFALSKNAASTMLLGSPLVGAQSQTQRQHKKKRTLLDVGAATGTTTCQLAPCFDQVVVTEASAVCRHVLSKNKNFQTMSSVELKNNIEIMGHGPYDVISLLNVLDRTDNPQVLLNEALALLRCDGNERERERERENGRERERGCLLLGFSHPLRAFVQPQTFDQGTTTVGENDALIKFFCGVDASSTMHDTFEMFVTQINDTILEPNELKIVKWSKFPYVAGGENEYQYMEQALFLVSKRQKIRKKIEKNERVDDKRERCGMWI